MKMCRSADKKSFVFEMTIEEIDLAAMNQDTASATIAHLRSTAHKMLTGSEIPAAGEGVFVQDAVQ